jgi:transcriptional regulator with PAS, ATPase and Fis domain
MTEPGAPSTTHLSDAQVRELVDASADAMLVVDRSGDIRFVNPAGEQLFGRSSEKLLGFTFGRPIATGDEAVRTEILRPGGETRVASMRASPIRWGDATAYVVTLRDIEDRVVGDVTRLQLHIGGLSHRLSTLQQLVSEVEARLRKLEDLHRDSHQG